MSCPCQYNVDIAKAAQLIAEVKADFEKCTTNNPAEIDAYEQKLHEARNGQEAALRKFRDDKRTVSSTIEAWVNAGKSLERLEKDARSIKIRMLVEAKINREAR